MQSERQGAIENLRKELILTHGAGLDKYGNVTVHGKDRINKSVELFKDGYSPRILMCGKHASKIMKEYAVSEHGLSGDRVLIDNDSISTAEELINAKKYHLRPNNWGSLYLVSNYWHGPRIVNLLAKNLLKGYDWKFEGAPDSRPDAEVDRDKLAEHCDFVRDSILVKTVYKFQ